MPSAKRQLIEHRLPTLDALVMTMRGDGASWFRIRDEIVNRTGVNVTHQTLINWFGDAA